MKRVLIISPYFPPSNAADMQRVRMSLRYFELYGWTADVVCVHPKHSAMVKDELLLRSLPAGQVVFRVSAWSLKWTSKVGLGSLALRSMWSYFTEVGRILRGRRYDLVYFSTTQFPLTILGRFWKWRYAIPYVIDMQDPWHSDYYQDKSKEQRPAKYWFSYRLHRMLEPVAMKKVDGLISVSAKYLEDLQKRYTYLEQVPTATIPFGYFSPDKALAQGLTGVAPVLLGPGHFNIVYIGRGGQDMHQAIAPVFKALKQGLSRPEGHLSRLKLYFIGTSYAPAGQGTPTVLPLAREYSVENNVIEITDRVSYYETLRILQLANALFIPSSDDPAYTASKLYPYLLAGKPLLAVLHQHSPAVTTFNDHVCQAVVETFGVEKEASTDRIERTLQDWARGILRPVKTLPGFEKFDAKELTGEQTDLFERSIIHFKQRAVK